MQGSKVRYNYKGHHSPMKCFAWVHLAGNRDHHQLLILENFRQKRENANHTLASATATGVSEVSLLLKLILVSRLLLPTPPPPPPPAIPQIYSSKLIIIMS